MIFEIKSPNIELRYIKGRDNLLADALSHLNPDYYEKIEDTWFPQQVAKILT